MTRVLYWVLLAAVTTACGCAGGCAGAGAGGGRGESADAARRQACVRLAAEMDTNLQQQVLKMWFPRAVDPAGGFAQDYREDWSAGGGKERSVVYQARLTWTAAQVVLRYPGQADEYRGFVKHGATFLAEAMWDKESGGFFWSLDAGKPVRGGEKHVYGVAFGIYGLVAAHAATGDETSLELAKRAFGWLEDHAHDAANGGYHEALDRAGRPILAGDGADCIGTRYGRKSMNTHLHLLEAYAALYQAWPDARVKARLQELFGLMCDKAAVDGAMALYFTPDWRPLPDVDSFGHDVESGYLLTEAAAVLGKANDERTWKLARQLVDHALAAGWDKENGGLCYEGKGGQITAANKAWWTQAESLNALLLMHGRFGQETPAYWDAFIKQWQFIQQHQIDAEHGGWLREVSREGKPQQGQIKSNAWTECYHQSRALMNVAERLRKMAE